MEMAPRVREDALSWCGKGHRLRLFRGEQKRRTADPRLLPHLQPRDAQLDTPYRHAVSPQIDLFHQGNGELRVCDRGAHGMVTTSRENECRGR